MEYRTGGAPSSAPPKTQKIQFLHTCSICNEVFDDRQLLQDHFRNHGTGSTAPKRKLIRKIEIQCDVCEAKFDTASKAVNHKFKVHRHNTEKYYCSWCGKQFTIKQMHEMHVQSDHFAEAKKIESQQPEKFSCDQCVAVFYVKDVYESHISQYHQFSLQYILNNVSVLPPSKKIIINCVGDVQSAYYCHLCGYEYVLKYNLQSHLIKYHKDHDKSQLPDEIIKCSTCDASFYNKKAYEVHNSFHQPGDMYVTSEEMRLNVVTRVDQDFDLRRVRVFRNSSPKPKRANHNLVNKVLIKDEDMSEFSPPPSDSSDSECEFREKTKIQTYSKKKPISLEDFVDMNKSIFENKPEEVPDDNVSKIKIESVRTLVVNTDEPFYNTESSPGIVDPLLDVKYTSPEKFPSKVTIKDAKILPNKSFVKVVTKEELEKLKIKGLMKVSKDHVLNMKKNNLILDEKPIIMNSQKRKSPTIVNNVLPPHSKDSKLQPNALTNKKDPYVKLTRINLETVEKNPQASTNKIISKSPLEVV